MSEEVCKEQIVKNIGIMYDERVAQAVIANWAGVLAARSIEENKRRALC